MSAQTFAGPLLVSVAYVLVYYLMISNQVRVKTRLRRAYRARGETFDRYFNTDREMLAADRLVGNMLEHMPAFLLLLWLNALFVGPRGASFAGGAYIVSRLLYPLMMGAAARSGRPDPDPGRHLDRLRRDRVPDAPPRDRGGQSNLRSA